MKFFFLIYGLFFSFFTAYPQIGLLKQFGVEDGLASNHVYAALQDKKGYIWLATSNGASRFDGKTFKNFTSNNGLPDNDILEIAEDAIGRIWLSCYSGEPCYIYNDRIYTANTDTLLKRIVKAGYLRFHHFEKRLILTQSQTGVNYEIDEKGHLTKTSLRGVFFRILGAHLLNVLAPNMRTQVTYYLHDRSYRKVDSLQLSSAVAGEAVQIKAILATGNDRFAVLMQNGDCYPYYIQHHRIMRSGPVVNMPGANGSYYSEGQLWLQVPNGGIVPLTPQLQQDRLRQKLFAGHSVQNFLTDREGNYWGCTPGQGLLLVPNNGFRYYDTGAGQGGILKLAAADNEVYLGCTPAILRYTGRGAAGAAPVVTIMPTRAPITDLCAGPGLVIASTRDMLLLFDRATGRSSTRRFDNIKCMHLMPDRTVLYGTHANCHQLFLPDSSIRVHKRRSSSVYARSNGDAMVGTMDGLVLARKNPQGKWVADTLKTPALLKSTRISCLGEKGNIIVAGTVQKGLVLIDGEDHELVDLGPGFRDINCKEVHVDAQGTIWLASFSGLFRIRLKGGIHDYEVEHLRQFNGLLSDDVNDVLVLNDTVYVAGPRGLTIFSTAAPAANRRQPPTLYIDEVLVSGRPYGLPGKELHLPADSNTVDLHVSAIDYKSLGHILFKYRLTEIHKTWQYSTGSTLRLGALPPGDYELQVWAMNAGRVWSAAPAQLFIHILPAWWQSAWFRLLLLLAGVALIYLTVRLSLLKKHRELMRKNSFRRHVTELQLRAIKAQINPHFIFNTLNAIQYFIGNNENERAEEYLERMAVLLRKTLDFSDKSTVPLHAEISYLENYLELEKLRFDENVAFTITSHLQPHQHNIEIPPMVLQPHIENALRHGFKDKRKDLKKLDISFSLLNNQLVCEVLDNGIGRKAAATGRGHASSSRSRGLELSHSKLLMYETVTGKSISTDIQDRYSEDRQTALGTLIRISITQ